MPRWLDLPMRGFKYLLLGFFAWAISTMSVLGIQDFMRSPYGLIADVKMLNFFRHIGETGLIVLGIFVVTSVFVPNFWCRFLCPYGALLGFVSLLSPARIRRKAEPCIDCGKCAKACPASLPVDKLLSIKSVECTGCMECVTVCPAESALYMGLPQLGAKQDASNTGMGDGGRSGGVVLWGCGICEGDGKLAVGDSGFDVSGVGAPRR